MKYKQYFTKSAFCINSSGKISHSAQRFFLTKKYNHAIITPEVKNMSELRYLLIFFQLLNLLLLLWIMTRYREDIEKRLAENRTHKELRDLKREIRQNLPSVRKRMLSYFTKGPLWSEREFLSGDMLPCVMPFIRDTLSCLEWLSLTALILSFQNQECIIFPAVGWSASLLIWIFSLIYHITDKISIKTHFPKASGTEKKIRKQNAFYKNPNHNRNYTKREWNVIIQAYLLRYSPIWIIFGTLTENEIKSLFLMGILGLITGITEEYHRRNRTEIFLCAYQDISHRRMTPFEHTESFADHACQEMKLVSVLNFTVSGMLLLTGCILYFYA